jgi:hypothetical protein
MRSLGGHGGSEILQKVHARTRILDQDRGRAMLRSESDDLAAQLRIFEATPVDIDRPGRIDRKCRADVERRRSPITIPATTTAATSRS